MKPIVLTATPAMMQFAKEQQERMEKVHREFDAEHPDLDPDDPDAVFAAMMAFANKKIAAAR